MARGATAIMFSSRPWPTVSGEPIKSDGLVPARNGQRRDVAVLVFVFVVVVVVVVVEGGALGAAVAGGFGGVSVGSFSLSVAALAAVSAVGIAVVAGVAAVATVVMGGAELVAPALPVGLTAALTTDVLTSVVTTTEIVSTAASASRSAESVVSTIAWDVEPGVASVSPRSSTDSIWWLMLALGLVLPAALEGPRSAPAATEACPADGTWANPRTTTSDNVTTPQTMRTVVSEPVRA